MTGRPAHLLARPELHGRARAERAELGDRIAQAFDGNVERTVLAHAYYSAGLRYTLWCSPPDGRAVPLAEGGAFDWLARLTSNRRAAFLASGVGSQLMALLFHAAQPRLSE